MAGETAAGKTPNWKAKRGHMNSRRNQPRQNDENRVNDSERKIPSTRKTVVVTLGKEKKSTMPIPLLSPSAKDCPRTSSSRRALSAVSKKTNKKNATSYSRRSSFPREYENEHYENKYPCSRHDHKAFQDEYLEGNLNNQLIMEQTSRKDRDMRFISENNPGMDYNAYFDSMESKSNSCDWDDGKGNKFERSLHEKSDAHFDDNFVKPGFGADEYSFEKQRFGENVHNKEYFPIGELAMNDSSSLAYDMEPQGPLDSPIISSNFKTNFISKINDGKDRLQLHDHKHSFADLRTGHAYVKPNLSSNVDGHDDANNSIISDHSMPSVGRLKQWLIDFEKKNQEHFLNNTVGLRNLNSCRRREHNDSHDVLSQSIPIRHSQSANDAASFRSARIDRVESRRCYRSPSPYRELKREDNDNSLSRPIPLRHASSARAIVASSVHDQHNGDENSSQPTSLRQIVSSGPSSAGMQALGRLRSSSARKMRSGYVQAGKSNDRSKSAMASRPSSPPKFNSPVPACARVCPLPRGAESATAPTRTYTPLQRRFRPKIKKEEVAATNDTCASVQKLSEWLSNDPFEQKKGKSTPIGRKILSKARAFEPDQPSPTSVDNEDQIRGSVSDRKKWIEGGYSIDVEEHTLEEDGFAKVSEGAKWLQEKAFKKKTNRTTLSNDLQDIS